MTFQNTHKDKRLILLVGLPGSGKSYYSKLLYKRFSKKYSTFIFDDECRIGIDININEYLKELSKYDIILIPDVKLCHKKIRDVATELFNLHLPEHKQSWLFFENNKEKALYNVQYRNDGRKVDSYLNRLSMYDYDIPNDITTKKIKNVA